MLFLLLITLVSTGMKAQEAKYPPLSEYMMPQADEVALAKSAAPEYVSDHATIKVFTTSGFQTAHEGDNGFVCIGHARVYRSSDVHSGPSPGLHQLRRKNPGSHLSRPTRPREPYCLITNFGQNWGWKARQPSKLPRGYKPLTPKARFPKRPEVCFAYMWSADQVLGPAGHWHPHLMVYLPYYATLLGTNTPKTLFPPSETMREHHLPSGLSLLTTNSP